MSDFTTFDIVYIGDHEERIRQAVDQSYNLTVVGSVEQAEQIIDYQTDCLLAEQTLVEQETFKTIGNEWPSLPVVVLTDKKDQAILKTALNQGCQDVIEWPYGEQGDQRLRTCLDQLQHRSTTDISQTVLEISRQLISAAPDETDTKIEWALRTLGERVGAVECVLYRQEGTELRPLYEWYHPETTTTRDPIEAKKFPGFTTHIEKFELVTVPRPDSIAIDVPDNFVARSEPVGNMNQQTQLQNYLKEYDHDCLIAVPVVIEWELRGVLAIICEEPRSWPADIRRQLRTFGEVIGHVIRREDQRQELEKQNQQLERFASVVAHDLRNPLNVIEGYADIIAETGNTEHIEDIQTAADRMEVMLDELLEVVRTQENVTERVPIDIRSLANEAWASVDTRSASLQVEDPGMVNGDPDRLRHVFENLFRNAIEHAGESVTVYVVGTDSGFAIEDNGPGIPEDQRARVFEEGYTGADGTGLGLAIVESIVTAHGWSVTVKEGSEGGARFEIQT